MDMASLLSKVYPQLGHPTSDGMVVCEVATNPVLRRNYHWTGTHDWLVVSTHLKNISQLGWLFPIYGKIKHVWNHQPDDDKTLGLRDIPNCSKTSAWCPVFWNTTGWGFELVSPINVLCSLRFLSLLRCPALLSPCDTKSPVPSPHF